MNVLDLNMSMANCSVSLCLLYRLIVMPNKKSAYKHLRQTKVQTVRNLRVKRSLKRFIQDARNAITEQNTEKLQEVLHSVAKKVDKAAHAGIIKKNGAARTKSRLMKQINTVLHAPKSSK